MKPFHLQYWIFSIFFVFLVCGKTCYAQNEKPRVIVTTDGEADDRASLVRFLLNTNEFDVEGIINSSSQFHWEGGEGWNAFHAPTWIKEYIDLYASVYGNLRLHDVNYPSPEYLLSKWKVGNIGAIGEDEKITEGSELIVQVLLDNDPRPVWVEAWGGCNTISRALKTIQQMGPEKMQQVASKLRLFLIWEQDETYQNYIRPNWEHLNIPTIISDQFDCMAYIWNKVLPNDVQNYFQRDWISQNILVGHGPLCEIYENNEGAFNAEGDTPAFLHSIPNGLRSMESPGNGGWGGRYVNVRNNVWMDPKPSSEHIRPLGRWGIESSWSKKMENDTTKSGRSMRTAYFKPIWRWLDDVQNDFAARADWCVKDYESANHHPVVQLGDAELNLKLKPGEKIILDASSSFDPDGDELYYSWWQYMEAGTYKGSLIDGLSMPKIEIVIPNEAKSGETVHIICELSDSGIPSLTKYRRIIITIL